MICSAALRHVVLVLTGTTAAPLISAASLTYVQEINSPITTQLTRLPKWTKGGLLTVQINPKQPLIWRFTGNGALSVPLSIPGAESTLIYDFDQGGDGTICVSGSATDGKGHVAPFVAWISPNSASAHITQMGLYRPAMITMAPDGTVWTVGSEVSIATDPPRIVPTAGVIRHLDRTGKTISSFVSQSTIRNPLLTLSGSRNTLRAIKDRIAWYSVDGRYVEISLAGEILTDIVVEIPAGEGEPMTGNVSFALTDKGEAFLNVSYSVPHTGIESPRTYVLDRSVRAWRPVQVAGEPPSRGTGYIFGVDDIGRLVVMNGNLIQFYAIGN